MTSSFSLQKPTFYVHLCTWGGGQPWSSLLEQSDKFEEGSLLVGAGT